MISSRVALAAALSLLCWAVLFLADFPFLLSEWSHPDLSHSYLILPIVAFMVWTVRDKLLESLGGGPAWGYIFLICAALCLAVGRLGSLRFFVYLSMWGSICGLTLALLGGKSLRVLRMPMFIGLFMVPLPAFIIRITSLRLRLISSVLSEKMLQLAGVPVYREGNIIDLGTTKLQVVDACSGLRYFWPSVLMALLVGWFFLKRPWQRILLLLLSVPVTIFANAFRISLTGVLSKYVDPALAEGFFHDFSGWLVYVLSLGLLGFFMLLLRRMGRAKDKEPDALEAQPEEQARPRRMPHWSHGLVAIGILAAMLVAQHTVLRPGEVPNRMDFSKFPMTIGHWQGTSERLSKPVLKSLGLDDYVNAVYRDKETGQVIYLLISWYNHQTTDHSAHAPTSCLVGGGWDVDRKMVLGPAENSGRSFPVAQMVLDQNGQELLSNFMFLQRGRVVTNEWKNKLYLLVDAVFQQRTDGALVRVETAVPKGSTVAEAQAMLDEFLGLLRKELTPFLPEGY